MRCRHKTKYKRAAMDDEERVQTRKAINALNRDRAKRMERRIAKYLQGSRVPMSGAAAQWKGDCVVELKNNPGKYIIECKLSSMQDEKKDRIEPYIPLQLEWFPKLQREVEAMRAKFGVLIIRFFFHNEDYVFVRREDLDRMIQMYDVEHKDDLLFALLNIACSFDIHLKKDGIPKKQHSLLKKELDQNFIQVGAITAAKIKIANVEYIVMYLKQFREIMERV